MLFLNAKISCKDQHIEKKEKERHSFSGSRVSPELNLHNLVSFCHVVKQLCWNWPNPEAEESVSKSSNQTAAWNLFRGVWSGK